MTHKSELAQNRIFAIRYSDFVGNTHPSKLMRNSRNLQKKKEQIGFELVLLTPKFLTCFLGAIY